MKHDNGKQENVMAISIVSLMCCVFGVSANLVCRCMSRIQRFEFTVKRSMGSFHACTYFIQSKTVDLLECDVTTSNPRLGRTPGLLMHVI